MTGQNVQSPGGPLPSGRVNAPSDPETETECVLLALFTCKPVFYFSRFLHKSDGRGFEPVGPQNSARVLLSVILVEFA